MVTFKELIGQKGQAIVELRKEETEYDRKMASAVYLHNGHHKPDPHRVIEARDRVRKFR